MRCFPRPPLYLFSFILFLLLAGSLPPEPAHAQTNVLFILDVSGSMNKIVGAKETRMDAAKRVMREALGSMPAGVTPALMLYGHRRKKDCTDIELIAPFGRQSAAQLAARVQGLKAAGETPIAKALETSVGAFAGKQGQTNSIVLLTDGIEECQGDPCAAASAVAAAGLSLKISIVGFTLTPAQRAAIECIPKVTGGTYYDAQDAGGLGKALAAVKLAVAEPPKAVEKNLLSKAEGGRLLAAPRGVFERANDGKEDKAEWVIAGDEAVFGFKGGQAATFTKFGFLVPQTESPPSFIELSVGDEGPLGVFRPLGTLKIVNMFLRDTPYQTLEFPPVTAHFLKVKFGPAVYANGSSQLNSQLWELRLTGELAGNPLPAAAPPVGVDLIGTNSGGKLVAASQDRWVTLTDGREQYTEWFKTDEEAIYSFKDGRPAELNAFTFLVDGTRQFPVSMEFFVGDEGPAGAFRPIGVFKPAMTLLYDTPYQSFPLNGVTAKFFKIKLGDGYAYGPDQQLSRQQNGAGMIQYRLIGTLK